MSNPALGRYRLVIDHLKRNAFLMRSACCGIVVVLGASLLAEGQTTTIDFDPPNFAAGSVLTTVGDVTFLDGPVVFESTVATTFSPPNALHSAQDCVDAACSSGAYMLRMNFAKPMSAVSLRAGVFGVNNPNACFPENDPCEIKARLVGYDTLQPTNFGGPQGNAVAASNDVDLGNYISGPITSEVTVPNPCGRIKSAILFVGKGIIGPPDGGAARAQIDHLSFTVAQGGTCTNSGPPTILITTPQSLQAFSYPYQITLTGSVAAPAGLFAFCTAINNPAMPAENQCNQLALVDGGGRFSLAITLPMLKAGANTIFAFAYDLSGQSASASVALSLQNPPPPTVTISEPTVSELFSTSNVNELGEMMSHGGLAAFCSGANETAPPTVAACNQTSSVDFFPTTGQGFFFSVPVPTTQLIPGVNTMDAWVYDRFGQLGQAHVTAVLPASPRIIGMEVTQGIQTMSIPSNIPGVPVAYNGTRLYFGGKTVVRVFANTPSGTLPNVPASLWATQGAGTKTRLLGVAFADNGSLTLTAGGTTVSSAQRADPNGGYVFTLPWTFDTQELCRPWESCVSPTNGPLTLIAVLFSSGDFPVASVCPGCGPSSSMTLTNVAFDGVNPVTISPVAITWTGSDGVKHSPNPSPSTIFAATGNIFPPGSSNLMVTPYVGTMDISDLLTTAVSQKLSLNWMRGAALGRLSGFGGGNPPPPGQLVGVVDSTGSPSDTSGFLLLDLGLTNLFAYAWPPRLSPASVMSQSRPLTSVAHELFHQFNYYHAGTSCLINEVFPAQHWPPDERGDIQGIGLDRSTQTSGTYRILTPGAADNLTVTSDGSQSCPAGPRTELFDFMSYCACPDESDSWTSIPDWNAWGSTFPSGLIPCGLEGCSTAIITEGSAPANAQTTRVVASVDSTGTFRLDSIEPGDGKHLAATTNSTDQTSYNIVVRDTSGQVISRTHVTPVVSHRHSVLAAEVLSTGGTRLEVERNGVVIASRDRSAHAPTVTILSPAAGTRLSGKTPTILKWNARDADGDPISLRVEYSRDDGKTYRTLSTGVSGDRVSLGGSLFGRAHEARIRIRANDGFNEALAVSERLSAEGPPPTVQIHEPVVGAHFRSDVPIRLVGVAFGDSEKQLAGKALKWYDGERLLGEGAQLSALDGKSGHRTIRLVVHDDDREAEASVDVFVDAVAPTFMGLRVPEFVEHGEDEVRIRLASSIPGVLVAGGQGFAVDRKPKEFKVPIPKGREDLRLTLVLVADGKTSTLVVRITRN